jgi:ferredoxin-thioredoxin reductase catalytic subunit
MEVNNKEIEKLYNELDKNARDYGYLLNPDKQFAKELVRGLIINTGRYGYPSCPCRLSEGKIEKDRDIICPCDYRDPDLNDFGACYCGLYVNREISGGEKQVTSIPERRNKAGNVRNAGAGLPVWRCRVCGYLCARENPPEICPICKAKKDRFERFF